MAIAAEDRSGSELAGYRIERVLGRGGMSAVYLAYDPRLNRNVALKLLAPTLAGDDSFRARFLRESRLAASLDHPNVVPVYEAGEVDALLYIAMRYVPGSDLRQLLAQGPLTPERALAVAAQIAGALDAAHQRGLVHRDVKPSNVLLTGRPGKEHCYLADFGLSTSATDRSVADTGQMLGTIDYIAPEQIRDADVDGRADVYSLACLLYECLVGDVPFRRASDVAVIYAHLEEPPPKASERAPALPPGIDGVLERGMAKDPGERWPTCTALLDAARGALLDGDAGVRVRRRSRRRFGLAAVLAGAAVATTLAVVLFGGGGTALAQSDSLVRVDLRSGNATRGLAVGPRPTAVTVCAGNVWVTTRSGVVFEVDPATLTRHRIDVSGTPSDVADVGALAAVVSGPPERVAMIDAEFGQISDVVDVPSAHASGTAVALGRDVWIANPTGRALALIDPPYTGIASSVRLPGAPNLIARGEGAVWAAGGRALWRVDPSRRRVVRSFRLGFAPEAMAVGNGGVWLVDRGKDAIVRLDPRSGREVRRIDVGRAPGAVALGPDSIWVANSADGTVSKIDPRKNAVVKTVDVGREPVDLVAGLGGLWVVRETG